MHTLLLLNDFNIICDARVDCVGSNPDRKGIIASEICYVGISWQSDSRLYHTDIPFWTCTNNNGSSRSYPYRFIVRSKDKKIVSCPQHHIVIYSDHKFVTCTIDLAKKEPKIGDIINNFQPITLINAELKILAEMLAKLLARIEGGFLWKVNSRQYPFSAFYLREGK